ncbi:MAG: hypothetical protein M3R27_16380, partial [Bacteroidota bacterium]|nr:hypothetical protein [Bacteroidota bacterium]
NTFAHYFNRTQILMIFMIKKDAVFGKRRSFMNAMITFGVYDKIGFNFSNELHWCYPFIRTPSPTQDRLCGGIFKLE